MHILFCSIFLSQLFYNGRLSSYYSVLEVCIIYLYVKYDFAY